MNNNEIFILLFRNVDQLSNTSDLEEKSDPKESPAQVYPEEDS